MAAPAPPRSPPSLLGITTRRAIVTGRTYLIVGIVATLLYGLIFAATSGPVFSEVFPLLLPVFGVSGGLGSLLVFTNDRVKGVLEYLMAYGVSPRRVFVNFLLASVALTTIIVGVTVPAALGLFLARGNHLTLLLVVLLGLYGIPMAFASIAFATTLGIFWTSLSSPRTGMNSPLGLLPMIGIAPALATLLVAVTLKATTAIPFLAVTGTSLGLVAVVVVVLLMFMGRLLPRERLLSPA